MKTTVVWEETWVRRAERDVDEPEYMAWLAESGAEPTDANLKEFVLAGREIPEPSELLGGTAYPGTRSGDEFAYHEITRVERHPQ